MPRRLRRPLLAVPVLLALTLSACGSDTEGQAYSGATADRLDAVTITGDAGTAPQVEWKARMDAGDLQVDTLTEGTGDEIQDGDQVVTNFWIGNGFSQELAYSTWGEPASTAEDGTEVPATDPTPETLTAGDSETLPGLTDALEGQKIGARVAVTGSAEAVLGSETGNPQLGIANEDTVLIILDLMEIDVPPTAKDVDPSKMPKIVEQDGNPTSFDFTGIPKPNGKLFRSIVTEGDGAELTGTETVTAKYLGQVFKGDAPFDENFSGEATEFSLDGVVEGWKYGLTGVKVGSRVILQIPPDLGYGSQEQNGIPADSTLYFVIDVVSAE